MNFKKNWKRFFTVSRASEGFTLVELIVVIAILAILAGTAVPAYSGYIKKANKAADLQLLGAVNTAFAAAVLENGHDVHDVDSATISRATGAATRARTSTAETGWRAVGATATIDGVSNDLTEAFLRYYGDNAGAVFKTIDFVVFDPATGSFVDQEMSQAFVNAFDNAVANMPGQITNVQNSAFATQIGADSLMSQVTDVASMAADLINNGGEGSALTGVVLSPDYIRTMAAKLGKTPEALQNELITMRENDPEAFSQYMANSTVLNVANTMNTMTAEQETALKSNLATLNFGNLATTLQNDPEEGLAQAALLYGMYTAFDPEGAQHLVNTQDIGALLELEDRTGTITDENGTPITFGQYIAQVNNEGSQAALDYAGYKSALDIVNQSASNDTDLANQIMNNGYSDPQLTILLQQIMG